MNKKFDSDTIQQINLFEKITRTNLKDLIQKDDTFLYIVQQGQIGKAIGKDAINIKRLTNITKKRIKIIEFNQKPEAFTKNFIHPLKPSSIKVENNVLEIEADRKTKGLLIGKNQQNLKILKNVIQEYFSLDVRIK